VLIVKVLHLWMVVSWFAGLFYLPRIFVNLAMVAPDSVAERERLLLMAGKLYRFMTPIGCSGSRSRSAGCGLASAFQVAGCTLKTTLVVLLLAYHAYCGRLLRDFRASRNVRSHVWFRWFNEMPVLVLLAATYLAVLKPF
jgi:putative membrane protein